MTCDEVRNILESGEQPLPLPLPAAVAEHLLGCAECRGIAEDRRILAPRVAGLPRTVEPARPLWEGIERRITRRTTRRLASRLLPLAAALLLALGAAWWARTRDRPEAGAFPEAFAGRQAAYLVAIGDLEPFLNTAALPAGARAAMQSDLVAIDQAIAEARAAVARDPGNGVLHTLYLTSLRRKLEVLRGVARLVKG